MFAGDYLNESTDAIVDRCISQKLRKEHMDVQWTSDEDCDSDSVIVQDEAHAFNSITAQYIDSILDAIIERATALKQHVKVLDDNNSQILSNALAMQLVEIETNLTTSESEMDVAAQIYQPKAEIDSNDTQEYDEDGYTDDDYEMLYGDITL